MKYRDFLALHILHHASEEPVTGSFLMKELEKHGYHISPGTIYPLLHELERKGLLKSRWEVRGGRRVRAYEITGIGRKTLDEGKERLKELCLEVLEE
jgi:DNA-binding PadR family transcriptional regulator